LLKRFEGDPDIEKARAEFDRAQKVEEQFHREFDGKTARPREPGRGAAAPSV
jgi:hypothetical protein